ncbi:hypothetical protein [Dinghuibacter silviterrae]|uniref:Uncharacterized protein n=1 Tax=Dinghuibacter silviterrae TaxID=1539049 RepID=A0A4R8DWD2_9BACT|nr:hypothetical protein [Dinghuibacter silviterrae]TDX02248.1 hypothetical protein EDB95_3303 [Dinghuibacter silviterrae]
MNKVLLALLCMAALSCSKSSNSSSGPVFITYTANGQLVTVDSITVDTIYDNNYNYPTLEIMGRQLLPGMTDSVGFHLFMEGGAYSAQHMTGLYSDTVHTHAGFYLESFDLVNRGNFFFTNTFDGGNPPSLVQITSNNGRQVTGTFKGFEGQVQGAKVPGLGDSIVVTNGSFRVNLP